MNTSVTVVNLIHDPKADTDTPKCWVFPACSWREKLDTSGTGTSKDPERTIQILHPGQRLHPGLPVLCAVGSPCPLPKRQSTGRSSGAGRWCRVPVPTLTAAEYAHLEKTHLCCTVSAISDNREPLLPHWHVEGS